MRIAEIYHSTQGEGLLTGTESVFVRTSGCNLRCWFCDTPHTSWSPEGEDVSVEDVLAQVLSEPCEHVVITGGEPMLLAELIPLAAGLRQAGRHITVETAGTLYLPVACDLMSISPKMANSTPPKERDARWHRRHELARHVPEVVLRLIAEFDYQIKFVVDVPEDFEDVQRYLEDMPQIDRSRVMLMPQGLSARELTEKGQWIEPYCEAQGLRYCPRRQIEWFGLVHGT